MTTATVRITAERLTAEILEHDPTIGSDSRATVRFGANTPPATPSPIGPLGDVEIGVLLATGGMGVLEKGVRRGLDCDVAVKRLRDPTDADAAARLIREAKLTAQLEHPSIVPVHDLHPDTHLGPVVTMELLYGRPWSEVLVETPTNSDSAWLRLHVGVVRQLCRALEYAHERGILHLDVKSENAIVNHHGEVRLFDWGIAHDLQRDPARTSILGTPAFLAPEMVAPGPKKLDGRTDVYLVGGCIYELIYGRGPHEADSLVLSMASILEGARFPPNRVPLELEEIARRALQSDPADRYPTMRDLREALDAFDRHLDSIALNTSALERLAVTRNTLRDLERCSYRLLSALTLWPENPRARMQLDRVRLAMLDAHLEAEDLGEARRIAEQVEELPPEHLARLQALEASMEAMHAAPDELERRDEDARHAFTALEQVLVVTWATFLVGVGVRTALLPAVLPAQSTLAGIGSLTAVAAIAITSTRPRWLRTMQTRTAAMSVLGALGGVFVNHLAGLLDSRPASQLNAADALIIGAAVLSASSLHPRTVPIALGAMALGCGALAAPHLATGLVFVAINGAILGTLVAWRTRVTA